LDVRSQVLIVVPVINEVNNLRELLPKIFVDSKDLSVLIIDDNSNDGTQEYLQSLDMRNLFIISRAKRYGIGSAHVLGLRFSKENSFSYVITMDGDQTHDPKYINQIVEVLLTDKFDLVLTSRFISKDGIKTWNLIRKILTRLGHILTIVFLRTSKDLTSGMRGYRVSSIDFQMLDWLIDSHYEFLPKSFYYYKKRKSKIDQIGIILPKRAYGSSKNNFKLMVKNASAVLFTSLQYAYHFRRNKNDS
jgi:dolichol-phosphate mannosyltransferase